MSRFFVDLDLSLGQHIELPETVFHHWIRVLRGQLEDQAILFNGQGGEYLVSLVDIGKKSATVHLLEFNPINRATPYQVTLGQVMSKGDRMDYAIQKATELGVHAIQLLTSERCEMRLKYDRDQKKLEHWQQVAISACEQCGLNLIPKVFPPLPLEQWLTNEANPSTVKLVLAPSQTDYNFGTPFPEQIQLLIGPEGGLSHDEINLALENQFHPWTLGDRILRTETAPVVALSALLYAKQFLN